MKKETYRKKALERDTILFKWDSKDIKVPYNPEFYLTTMGSLGYDLVNKRWVKGSFTGIMDEYGDFTTYVGTTLNSTPETVRLTNHTEVVVCGNTLFYRPFNDERDYYSELKAETDTSIECQLINSRLNKAIVAENDQKKKQIEAAYKAIKNGYPLVLVTSLLESLDVIDLTDPDDIEKMQYLSGFYQTIEKREANDSGIDLENVEKRAQLSVEEIKQYSDYTTIEFLTMYESRLRFVNEMRANNIDISIVKNPVYFDEPTESDIDTGSFESAETEDTTEDSSEDKEVNNENIND